MPSLRDFYGDFAPTIMSSLRDFKNIYAAIFVLP
jgi:hypothetical protein